MSTVRGILFLDLDMTVLNTDLMRAEMLSLAMSHGVPRDIWQKALDKAMMQGYTFDRHLSLVEKGLAEGLQEKFEALVADVLRVYNSLQRYVFSDVRSLIDRAHAQRWRVMIATCGNRTWQTEEAARSGLMARVDGASVFADNAEKGLRVAQAISNSDNVIFVDNDPRALDATRDNLFGAGVETWLINRVPPDRRTFAPGENWFSEHEYLTARKIQARESRYIHSECTSLDDVSIP